MLDSITTNLFVILVYLIPGSMLVFFICYVKPNIFFCRIENEKKNYLRKTYFVIFSLFFGVLLHSLNHTVFYPLERSFSKKIRSEYKEKYLTAYKFLKWKQLGENNDNGYMHLSREFDPIENEIDYLLTEKLVKEKAKRENETVFRLEAFHYLCRNSIIPSILVFLGIFFLKSRRKRKDWLWLVLSLLAIESVLVGASYYYLGAKITNVLTNVAVID